MHTLYTPHTIAIHNHKGGVGKTTTCHSLAHALARDGDAVLMIDADPQANLSDWCGLVGVSPTLHDVIRGESTLPAAIHRTDSGVDVIPAPTDGRMIAAEALLMGSGMAPHRWLSEHVATLPRDRWQWILIDCPPAVGLLTQGAMTISQWVICPVVPRAIDAAGVASVLKFVSQAQTLLNPDLQLLGILPTMVDHRVGVTGEVLAQLDNLGPKIMDTRIPTNSPMIAAPAYHQSIFAHDTRSTSARAYFALSQEVRQRVS